MVAGCYTDAVAQAYLQAGGKGSLSVSQREEAV